MNSTYILELICSTKWSQIQLVTWTVTFLLNCLIAKVFSKTSSILFRRASGVVQRSSEWQVDVQNTEWKCDPSARESGSHYRPYHWETIPCRETRFVSKNIMEITGNISDIFVTESRHTIDRK